MKIYLSNNHDPYFNLATEEFFLKHSELDLFMIYTNESSIIAGKHQNILSEINSPFIYRNNIKISRRLSGGGTVYHDLENINFSFIRTVNGSDMINYRKFASPILESLRLLGLNVQFSDRNDMIIDNMKISGSAMHVYKNRVLAHGTILLNSNLEKLSGALKCNSYKYTDKSIKSVRSKTTNIKNYLPELSTKLLINHIISTNRTDNLENNSIILSENDMMIISNMVENKYYTFEWIYGYSPKYEFKASVNISGNISEIIFSVEKGIIKETNFQSLTKVNNGLTQLCHNLTGKKHEIRSLLCDEEIIQSINQLPNYTETIFSEDFF
jgi:lipoate-protein ligase A